MQQQRQAVASPPMPPLVALIGVRSRVQELSGRLKTCLEGLQDLAEEDGLLSSMDEELTQDAKSVALSVSKGLPAMRAAHDHQAKQSLPGHAVAWVEISQPAMQQGQLHASEARGSVDPPRQQSSFSSSFNPASGSTTRGLHGGAHGHIPPSADTPSELPLNGAHHPAPAATNGVGYADSRQRTGSKRSSSGASNSSLGNFEQQLLRSEQQQTPPVDRGLSSDGFDAQAREVPALAGPQGWRMGALSLGTGPGRRLNGNSDSGSSEDFEQQLLRSEQQQAAPGRGASSIASGAQLRDVPDLAGPQGWSLNAPPGPGRRLNGNSGSGSSDDFEQQLLRSEQQQAPPGRGLSSDGVDAQPRDVPALAGPQAWGLNAPSLRPGFFASTGSGNGGGSSSGSSEDFEQQLLRSEQQQAIPGRGASSNGVGVQGGDAHALVGPDGWSPDAISFGMVSAAPANTPQSVRAAQPSPRGWSLQPASGSSYAVSVGNAAPAAAPQHAPSPSPRGWSLQAAPGTSSYALSVASDVQPHTPPPAPEATPSPAPRGWGLQATPSSVYSISVGGGAEPDAPAAQQASAPAPSPRGWSLQAAAGTSSYAVHVAAEPEPEGSTPPPHAQAAPAQAAYTPSHAQAVPAQAVSMPAPHTQAAPAQAASHGWSLQAAPGSSYEISLGGEAASDAPPAALQLQPLPSPTPRGWSLQAAPGTSSYAVTVGNDAPAAALAPAAHEALPSPGPRGWSLQPASGSSYAVSVGEAADASAPASFAPEPLPVPSPRGWSLQPASGSSYAITTDTGGASSGGALGAGMADQGHGQVALAPSPSPQQQPVRFGVDSVPVAPPLPAVPQPICFGVSPVASPTPDGGAGAALPSPGSPILFGVHALPAPAAQPPPAAQPQPPIRFGVDGVAVVPHSAAPQQAPILFGINPAAAPPLPPAAQPEPAFRFGVDAAVTPPAAAPSAAPAAAPSAVAALRAFQDSGISPDLLPPPKEIVKSSRPTIDPSMLSPHSVARGVAGPGGNDSDTSSADEPAPAPKVTPSAKGPSAPVGEKGPTPRSATPAVPAGAPEEGKQPQQPKAGAVEGVSDAGAGGSSPRPRARMPVALGGGGVSPLRSPSGRRTPSSFAGSPSAGSPRTRLQLGKVIPAVRQLVMEDLARKGLDQVVTSMGRQQSSRLARQFSSPRSASPAGQLSPRSLPIKGAGRGVGNGSRSEGVDSDGVETGRVLVSELPGDAPAGRGDGVLRRVLLRMGASGTEASAEGSDDSEEDGQGAKDEESGDEEDGREGGEGRRVGVGGAGVETVPGLGEDVVRVRKSLLLLRGRSVNKARRRGVGAMAASPQPRADQVDVQRGAGAGGAVSEVGEVGGVGERMGSKGESNPGGAQKQGSMSGREEEQAVRGEEEGEGQVEQEQEEVDAGEEASAAGAAYDAEYKRERQLSSKGSTSRQLCATEEQRSAAAPAADAAQQQQQLANEVQAVGRDGMEAYRSNSMSLGGGHRGHQGLADPEGVPAGDREASRCGAAADADAAAQAAQRRAPPGLGQAEAGVALNGKAGVAGRTLREGSGSGSGRALAPGRGSAAAGGVIPGGQELQPTHEAASVAGASPSEASPRGPRIVPASRGGAAAAFASPARRAPLTAAPVVARQGSQASGSGGGGSITARSFFQPPAKAAAAVVSTGSKTALAGVPAAASTPTRLARDYFLCAATPPEAIPLAVDGGPSRPSAQPSDLASTTAELPQNSHLYAPELGSTVSEATGAVATAGSVPQRQQEEYPGRPEGEVAPHLAPQQAPPPPLPTRLLLARMLRSLATPRRTTGAVPPAPSPPGTAHSRQVASDAGQGAAYPPGVLAQPLSSQPSPVPAHTLLASPGSSPGQGSAFVDQGPSHVDQGSALIDVGVQMPPRHSSTLGAGPFEHPDPSHLHQASAGTSPVPGIQNLPPSHTVHPDLAAPGRQAEAELDPHLADSLFEDSLQLLAGLLQEMAAASPGSSSAGGASGASSMGGWVLSSLAPGLLPQDFLDPGIRSTLGAVHSGSGTHGAQFVAGAWSEPSARGGVYPAAAAAAAASAGVGRGDEAQGHAWPWAEPPPEAGAAAPSTDSTWGGSSVQGAPLPSSSMFLTSPRWGRAAREEGSSSGLAGMWSPGPTLPGVGGPPQAQMGGYTASAQERADAGHVALGGLYPDLAPQFLYPDLALMFPPMPPASPPADAGAVHPHTVATNFVPFTYIQTSPLTVLNVSPRTPGALAGSSVRPAPVASIRPGSPSNQAGAPGSSTSGQAARAVQGSTAGAYGSATPRGSMATTSAPRAGSAAAAVPTSSAGAGVSRSPSAAGLPDDRYLEALERQLLELLTRLQAGAWEGDAGTDALPGGALSSPGQSGRGGGAAGGLAQGATLVDPGAAALAASLVQQVAWFRGQGLGRGSRGGAGASQAGQGSADGAGDGASRGRYPLVSVGVQPGAHGGFTPSDGGYVISQGGEGQPWVLKRNGTPQALPAGLSRLGGPQVGEFGAQAVLSPDSEAYLISQGGLTPGPWLLHRPGGDAPPGALSPGSASGSASVNASGAPRQGPGTSAQTTPWPHAASNHGGVAESAAASHAFDGGVGVGVAEAAAAAGAFSPGGEGATGGAASPGPSPSPRQVALQRLQEGLQNRQRLQQRSEGSPGSSHPPAHHQAPIDYAARGPGRTAPGGVERSPNFGVNPPTNPHLGHPPAAAQSLPGARHQPSAAAATAGYGVSSEAAEDAWRPDEPPIGPDDLSLSHTALLEGEEGEGLPYAHIPGAGMAAFLSQLSNKRAGSEGAATTLGRTVSAQGASALARVQGSLSSQAGGTQQAAAVLGSLAGVGDERRARATNPGLGSEPGAWHTKVEPEGCMRVEAERKLGAPAHGAERGDEPGSPPADAGAAGSFTALLEEEEEGEAGLARGWMQLVQVAQSAGGTGGTGADPGSRQVGGSASPGGDVAAPGIYGQLSSGAGAGSGLPAALRAVLLQLTAGLPQGPSPGSPHDDAHRATVGPREAGGSAAGDGLLLPGPLAALLQSRLDWDGAQGAPRHPGASAWPPASGGHSPGAASASPGAGTGTSVGTLSPAAGGPSARYSPAATTAAGVTATAAAGAAAGSGAPSEAGRYKAVAAGTPSQSPKLDLLTRLQQVLQGVDYPTESDTRAATSPGAERPPLAASYARGGASTAPGAAHPHQGASPAPPSGHAGGASLAPGSAGTPSRGSLRAHEPDGELRHTAISIADLAASAARALSAPGQGRGGVGPSTGAGGPVTSSSPGLLTAAPSADYSPHSGPTPDASSPAPAPGASGAEAAAPPLPAATPLASGAGSEASAALAPLREALLSACAVWQLKRSMDKQALRNQAPQAFLLGAEEAVRAQLSAPSAAGGTPYAWADEEGSQGEGRSAPGARSEGSAGALLLAPEDRAVLRFAFQQWRAVPASGSASALRGRNHQARSPKGGSSPPPPAHPDVPTGAGKPAAADARQPGKGSPALATHSTARSRPFLSSPGEHGAGTGGAGPRATHRVPGQGAAAGGGAAASGVSPRSAGLRLTVSAGGKLRRSEQALAQELLQQLVALGLGPAGPAPHNRTTTSFGGSQLGVTAPVPVLPGDAATLGARAVLAGATAVRGAGLGAGAPRSSGSGYPAAPFPNQLPRHTARSAVAVLAAALPGTRATAGPQARSTTAASVGPGPVRSARVSGSPAFADGGDGHRPLNIQPASSPSMGGGAGAASRPRAVTLASSYVSPPLVSSRYYASLAGSAGVSPGLSTQLGLQGMPHTYSPQPPSPGVLMHGSVGSLGVARPLDLAFYGVQDAVQDPYRPGL